MNSNIEVYENVFYWFTLYSSIYAVIKQVAQILSNCIHVSYLCENILGNEASEIIELYFNLFLNLIWFKFLFIYQVHVYPYSDVEIAFL